MRIDKNKFNLLLAEKCLTSKELCKKADIEICTLTKILKNARTPRPQTIGKIAKALGVRVIDIIEEQ